MISNYPFDYSIMNLESVSSQCGAKPFYTPCLRQTKSLTSKKMESHTVPRRSYSNTSVYMRKKQADDPLLTRNKSRLLRTLTDLFLKRRRRQHEQSSCWHSQTYTVDLKDDDSNSRPIKKIKRQHKPHAENWWAVSPSPVPVSAF
ncbi:hypothetical protein LRAMOSA09170 [Lichtheimia ramosa]|uniref:Uncharacterized protein n=1 Tax=Lichtheimia ramosa TaxID=688394 RepID=A0A077WHZ2_9FUNG|nr:hypothetical protein LRAMOSA09170 [Lichtheimia ramosa]